MRVHDFGFNIDTPDVKVLDKVAELLRKKQTPPKVLLTQVTMLLKQVGYEFGVEEEDEAAA
jgi:hypothetical protein